MNWIRCTQLPNHKNAIANRIWKLIIPNFSKTCSLNTNNIWSVRRLALADFSPNPLKGRSQSVFMWCKKHCFCSGRCRSAEDLGSAMWHIFWAYTNPWIPWVQQCGAELQQNYWWQPNTNLGGEQICEAYFFDKNEKKTIEVYITSMETTVYA